MLGASKICEDCVVVEAASDVRLLSAVVEVVGSGDELVSIRMLVGTSVKLAVLVLSATVGDSVVEGIEEVVV